MSGQPRFDDDGNRIWVGGTPPIQIHVEQTKRVTAGIPPRFRADDIDSILGTTPDGVLLGSAVRGYVDAELWNTETGMLITSNESQVGKTLAASVIANAAIDAGVWPVLFVEWSQLRDEASTPTSAFDEPKREPLLTRARSAKLLVLDDIGEVPGELPGWKRAMARETMFAIVGSRWNDMLPTIFCAAMSINHISAQYDILPPADAQNMPIKRKTTLRILGQIVGRKPIHLSGRPWGSA